MDLGGGSGVEAPDIIGRKPGKEKKGGEPSLLISIPMMSQNCYNSWVDPSDQRVFTQNQQFTQI